MNIRRIRSLSLMLGACLVVAASAHAQETTLSGTVTDATEAVMPGVTVTATHVDTGNTYVGVSEGNGVYRIGAMRPGLYKITSELSGFTTVTRENVELLLGQNVIYNVKLTLASVTESLTVTGQAPLL